MLRETPALESELCLQPYLKNYAIYIRETLYAGITKLTKHVTESMRQRRYNVWTFRVCTPTFVNMAGFHRVIRMFRWVQTVPLTVWIGRVS